jgi:hypothetical protein
MNLRERASEFTDALLGDGTPEPRTRDREDVPGGYGLYQDARQIDTITPDENDLEKFWEQYQTCSLVRVAIRMYREDVTEPGYRVQTDNESLTAELESWLAECAIINGESDHDISELWDATITQKEVRGTALAEVVPQASNSNNIWGFRLINVSTVNAYTYENKAVLIRPADDELDDAVLTDSGEAAAYGQWDDDAIAGPFNDTDTVPLSQDDIVKLTQDGDTDDIFGTSTIAPVSKEIDELQQMLHDISQAIHSKGYPHWIFKLGEPNGDVSDPRAGIWPDEEMRNYRQSHKEGNWNIGQKDFVPGDVDVETISSDVPEIEELLDWYVEQIISAMPVPKFKIGHADSVNRDITKTQQEQYEHKVQAERRRLENTYQPLLKRKAREWGYSGSDVDSIALMIEEPRGENPLARDDFDAGEFKAFANGVQQLSGGSPEAIVTADEAREMLGLPTGDERDASDDAGEANAQLSKAPALDEDDEQVREQFEQLYGEPAVSTDSELADAHTFDEGDYVQGESSGGAWYGVVVDYKLDGCFNDRIDGDVEICANDEEAVYLIEDVSVETGEPAGSMKAHLEGSVDPWAGPENE